MKDLRTIETGKPALHEKTDESPLPGSSKKDILKTSCETKSKTFLLPRSHRCTEIKCYLQHKMASLPRNVVVTEQNYCLTSDESHYKIT